MLNTANNTQYFRQLDTLRAFAVLLVIISHWFSTTSFLNKLAPNGILGVTLFFVISGYLITGILLQNKNAFKVQKYNIHKAFKTFYIRRALRIFPPYYFLLLLICIFNFTIIKKSFWWHFTYTSNFYFFFQNQLAGSLSHFWSLSVEEQFYIIWPALIFFTPNKYLNSLFLTGIIIAIIYRFLIYNPPSNIGRFLMPGSLDSFCLGGLLVFHQQNGSKLYNWLRKNRILVLLSCLLIYFIFNYFIGKERLYLTLYFTIISILFAQIILICSNEVSTPFFATILNNRLLIYLGKISYGLYLYHNFVPYIYNLKFDYVFGIYSFYVVQLLRFLVLTFIATLSWYLLEKPILNLKNKFEYAG